MATAPRFDKSKQHGTIHPPMDLQLDGETAKAAFEQNHHYFDVHGTYLTSQEGYAPGADTGAPADKVIADIRNMSPEAREKIMRELGLAPAEDAKKPRRKAPAAAVADASDALETETVTSAPPQSGGPLISASPQEEPQRYGGIDLVGWARGTASYPMFQVKKSVQDAFPEIATTDTKSIVAGLVARGLLAAEEVKRT